jgi:hypothetical protein
MTEPQDNHILIPRTYEYYFTWQKRTLRMNIRLLRWKNPSGLSECTQWNYELFLKDKVNRKRCGMETEVQESDARKGPQISACRQPLEAGSRFYFRDSRRSQPCKHLDFSSVKLTSHFLNTEKYKIINLCFQPLCGNLSQ